ncbi:hypoxanthine-guanine phosphoribosyltransferase [Williamsoniiplasma somnilux]|uniref:Hypoxanthine phosphoribosyltransferase n=2 Tax=Williamsoniiplasma somnilux TaxID=215578 RepID=A0A2K8NYP0_9MOLU|nr:hypoxanthine phosphoribosyltransferase [Williamsoniiplasma somnilux]ATZ18940.1 hypoxanthine-guanine phosphoribosyltransferase [Williamsoniiplasma somnilux]
MKIHPLVKDVLFTREQIQAQTKKIAQDIVAYYKGQNLKNNTIVLIGLMKGCIPFMAEFLANFEMECETDFMVVSSYKGGLKTSGDPKIVLDINTSLRDRDVLIIEDVIDSGITLEYMKNYFSSKGTNSVKIVTLIDKKGNREVDIVPDWTCFEIGPEFIIGFGLDYQERLRNLPYVATCDTNKLKDWKW